MKDLSRHIEYLLSEHNSVAVPGIGLFVAEEIPARFYGEENIYIPPVRSVKLDSSNTEDDGKLENCLIQLHHITRAVAKKWVSDYTDYINQQLLENNCMDMSTIGRLVVYDGKLTFEVCEAGVNSPELYGLDSFHFQKLPSYAHKNNVTKDPTHFTIRLRRTTVHRAMTAAAMLIIALTVILPNHGIFTQKNWQAKFATTESIISIFNKAPQPISTNTNVNLVSIPTATVEVAEETPMVDIEEEAMPVVADVIEAKEVTEAETVVAEEISIEQQATVETEITTEAEVEAETETEDVVEETQQTENLQPEPLQAKGYCVVMASAITHRGAERLIEKLTSEGIHNAIKHIDNGMLRVVLAGYPDEQSARASLAVVRNIDDLYSGSWIKKF